MKNNSDKIYEKFKNLDFANAQPVALTKQLQRLQAMAGVKSRITMRVDSSVLAVFRARAELLGGSYQTLMNDALKQFAEEPFAKAGRSLKSESPLRSMPEVTV